MAEINGDAIAQRISRILKPLLDMEDSSYCGSSYQSSTEEILAIADDDGVSNTVGACGGLRIHIPHLGAIKIERITDISRITDATALGEVQSQAQSSRLTQQLSGPQSQHSDLLSTNGTVD